MTQHVSEELLGLYNVMRGGANQGVDGERDDNRSVLQTNKQTPLPGEEACSP